MRLDKMKFRMFQWQENPEQFKIESTCLPKYSVDTDGSYTFEGLEPLCRVISGKGVFCGPEAVQQFNALAVIMATKTEGELYHPVWGTTTAYLTELTLEQESRPEYIVYSFVFRETDESGCIPRLPEMGES